MSFHGDYDEGEDEWDEGIDFGEVTETGSNLSEESAFWTTKDGIICLVDTGEAMFEREGDGESAFQQECAFYGTKEKENPSDLPGILLFADLDVPDAERILRLEQLLVKDFVGKYGRSDKEVPLGDALWTCSTVFGNCATKVGTKRVFLFTNKDNPNGDDPALQAQAKQRASDLRQLGIQIELFPLNPPSNLPFLGSKFYHEVVDPGEEGDLDQLDGSSKLEELLDRARSKEYKKRSQGKLSFFLTPDTELGVRVYNLVQETKKGTTTLLDGKTSQPLRTIVKKVCEDTGTLLLDSQVKHGYNFGGVRVMIEKHEMRDIRTLGTPGIKLLGFKPRSALKDYHNIKHSSFIYPDESAIRGSSVAYAALLKKMLEMDKIGIAQMIARSNASLRLVALVPFQEMVKDGIQVYPSGLYVIYLPFADDIRREAIAPVAGIGGGVDPNESQGASQGMKKADEAQIAAGVSLVRKLRIEDFDCRDFDNPVLQHHYMTLEAIALDRREDEIIIPQDSVQPDLDGMDRLSNLLNNFNSAIFPPSYTPPDPKQTPGKRKPNTKKRAREEVDGLNASSDLLTSSSSGLSYESPSAKRKRVADDIDWASQLANGTIAKCTLDQLKAYCSSHGIRGFSTLKKAQLVETVSQHIEQSNGGGGGGGDDGVMKTDRS